jgi:hypothetical protein
VQEDEDAPACTVTTATTLLADAAALTAAADLAVSRHCADPLPADEGARIASTVGASTAASTLHWMHGAPSSLFHP